MVRLFAGKLWRLYLLPSVWGKQRIGTSCCSIWVRCEAGEKGLGQIFVFLHVMIVFGRENTSVWWFSKKSASRWRIYRHHVVTIYQYLAHCDELMLLYWCSAAAWPYFYTWRYILDHQQMFQGSISFSSLNFSGQSTWQYHPQLLYRFPLSIVRLPS